MSRNVQKLKKDKTSRKFRKNMVLERLEQEGNILVKVIDIHLKIIRNQQIYLYYRFRNNNLINHDIVEYMLYVRLLKTMILSYNLIYVIVNSMKNVVKL